jgi:protein-arginine kinase activator protein McsA
VSTSVLDEAGIVSETRVDDPTITPVPSSESTVHLAPAVKESAEEDTRVSSLEKQLANAIANEDYERAATLRDEINRLKG